MKSIISTAKLQINYGNKIIIESLDIEIPRGEITVIIGANGSGKSTLLKTMARLLKPASGMVFIDDESIFTKTSKAFAKKLSILPQHPQAPESITVLQLIKQGRFPYQNWHKQWSKEDQQIVEEAMESTGLTDLAHEYIENLSGGQRQRAWIAMTLAQQTEIIFLDEPTNFLDVTYQIDVLDLLKKFNKEQQRTIVMVLHDMNLACRYATNLIVLSDKDVYAQGHPKGIFTKQLVKDVFNLESEIINDPIYHKPLCIPYSKY